MYWKRGGVVFGVKDMWDLDHSLSPIIAAGLKKFKEVVTSEDNCTGIPGSFLPEWEHTDEDCEVALKEWYSVLDKMIYAFDSESPEVPDGVFNDLLECLTPVEGTEYSEIKNLVKDQTLYDKYREEDDEHHRRVQEGLDLFAKHYHDLWT